MPSQRQGRHLHPATTAHPGLTDQVCGLMPYITRQKEIDITQLRSVDQARPATAPRHAMSKCMPQKVTLQDYQILQSIILVLLCTTNTIPYYSVLQNITTVLLCTTKYYSNITKYYSATTLYLYSSSTILYYKILLRITKYYSSTTPYYKVILQYTKYYSSTTLYYCSIILYNNVLLQYYKILQHSSALHIKRYFTLRGLARASVQFHQILRLPRKMIFMIDIRDI